MTNDRISLKAMRFHTRVGLLPHEEHVAQPLELDLTVWLSLRRVGESDSPEALLDYRHLYQMVSDTVAPARTDSWRPCASALPAKRLPWSTSGGCAWRPASPMCPSMGRWTTSRWWWNEARTTPMGEWAFVALGSNVGDRAAHLETGRHKLATLPGTSVLAESAIEETAPLGPAEQGKFLNQMVLLDTEQNPADILVAAQAAEQAAGRVREERWGPRTLDVDIVRFGEPRHSGARFTRAASRTGTAPVLAARAYRTVGHGQP